LRKAPAAPPTASLTATLAKQFNPL